MNHRPERVGKLIQEELAALLLREAEFPGSIVTVNEVEVSKKLDAARVRLGVVPSERAEAAFKAAQAARGKLQFLLSRKLQIKPMPRLLFELDRGAENAAAVEKRVLEEHGGV